MEHFLSLGGVDKSQYIALGKNTEKICGFIKTAIECIEDHENDQFLIIVDENLDIAEGAMHQDTVLGSRYVEKMQEILLPEDEQERCTLGLCDERNDLAVSQLPIIAEAPSIYSEKAFWCCA
eukprot:213069-Ditylum_brightwellii.AAC.1